MTIEERLRQALADEAAGHPASTTPYEEIHRRGRRRRIASAASSAVVLLAVVSLGVVVARSFPGPGPAAADTPTTVTTVAPTTTVPVATTPAPTNTASTTAASTTTPAAPATTVPPIPAMSWERLVEVDPGHVGALATDGSVYVRAGTISETEDGVADDAETPAVWVSEDARTWERVGEQAFAGIDGGIRGVTFGPAGFVAVGTGSRPTDTFSRGLVWTSADGRAWTPVADDEDAFVGSGFAVVEAVAAGGPGYVAVGWENPAGSDTNAVVWVSEDGRSWSRVEDPDLLGSPEGGTATDMVGVLQVDSGLIAFGSAVWVSPDGTDWSRIPRESFEELQSTPSARHGRAGLALGPMALDPSDGGLVVFRSGPRPEVWTSEDATVWVRTETPDASWNGDGDGVSAVASDGTVLLAAGWIDQPGSFTLWGSADGGTTWQRVESAALEASPGRILRAATTAWTGDRFVMVGDDCDLTAADCHPVTWIGAWTG
jgi:hypothetical protein